MSEGMIQSVSKLEAIIGYHFSDPTLPWEALQAAGSPVRFVGDRPILDGNKPLAILGDAVADHWLFLNMFRTTSKGACDRRRQELLSNSNFNRIGRKLSIEKLLVLSPGAEIASPYMVATMMEAIIGAVSLDGDMPAVAQVMEKLGIFAAL